MGLLTLQRRKRSKISAAASYSGDLAMCLPAIMGLARFGLAQVACHSKQSGRDKPPFSRQAASQQGSLSCHASDWYVILHTTTLTTLQSRERPQHQLRESAQKPQQCVLRIEADDFPRTDHPTRRVLRSPEAAAARGAKRFSVPPAAQRPSTHQRDSLREIYLF